MAANEEHLDSDPAPDMEVLETGTVDGIDAAAVLYDGEEMLMADVNQDGVIDTVFLDDDGDGEISPYEYVAPQQIGLDLPIDIADLQQMDGQQNVDDTTQIASVDPNYNDYQPDGFDEMIAMNDYSDYDGIV